MRMVCKLFETSGFLRHMGVSENVVYPKKPNGFADHYPVFKWLFHWEYTLFFQKGLSWPPKSHT